MKSGLGDRRARASRDVSAHTLECPRKMGRVIFATILRRRLFATFCIITEPLRFGVQTGDRLCQRFGIFGSNRQADSFRLDDSAGLTAGRSEEHTSELQSRQY